MNYRNSLPTSFIYNNISELNDTREHKRYRVFKFDALHKNKYIHYQLKAIYFNKDLVSDNFIEKYNYMLKKLGQVPNEFLLGTGKVFDSTRLIKDESKAPMIICNLNEKTLEHYLKETSEFLVSNKNNLVNVKKNIKRVKSKCFEALKQLHSFGLCYDRIHIGFFQGNHNMDEIYLQYFEHIVLCSDEKQKKENRKELTQIFSKYTL